MFLTCMYMYMSRMHGGLFLLLSIELFPVTFILTLFSLCLFEFIFFSLKLKFIVHIC